MLFNSFQFAAFIIPVYLIYLFLNHKGQNRFLLVASYFFYGCWDWRFLGLIAASTIVDYFCGLKIESASGGRRKLFLWVSLCFNLGVLGIFKYCNFFLENFQALVRLVGWEVDALTLNIILPVGISFYTFQTMSYTLDVYLKKINATHHFFDFALYVAFFPQLVAGPIERADHFLSQVLRHRQISLQNFYEGCWLIFWGLYKKVFIADNCAKMVDTIFAGDYSNLSASKALVGIYAFSWQIYGDFSGYTDIARGVAKIMGFDLILNFNVPYFSKNITEFWQRWHISLSTWLNDYLYTPLALRVRYWGVYAVVFSSMVTFLLSGLWHGAGWHFIAWGFLHGLGLSVLALTNKKRKKWKKKVPAYLYNSIAVLVTFHYVCFTNIFWRAPSIGDSFQYLKAFGTPWNVGEFGSLFGGFLGWVGLLWVVQIFQFRSKDTLCVLKWNPLVRGALYFVILFCILRFGVFEGTQFIYFQF